LVNYYLCQHLDMRPQAPENALVKGATMQEFRKKGRFRHPVRTAVIAGVLLVVGAGLGVGGLKAAHKLHLTTASSVTQASAGYDLDAPTSAAIVGGDLFVTNQAGNSVSVLNATTGSHKATIAGPSFAFDRPTAIVALGQDLFIANGGGNSVTEIKGPSRSLARVISGAQFQFSDPIALAAQKGRLYVLSTGGPVTAVSTTSGDLIGVAAGSAFGFSHPMGLAVTGRNLYVTNRGANTVTEVDDRTMRFSASLAGAKFGFQAPTGAAIDGKDLWVTNAAGDSVSEIATRTGQPVRVVVDHTNIPTPGPITVGDGYVFTVSPPGDSPMVTQVEPDSGAVPWMMCNTNGPYLFSNPQAAVVSGSNLWVVSKASSSLTEMNTDSGALIRTIS
jgi:YVTN family beta-propeller protein